MTIKKPTTVYRQLFRDAFTTTWQNKKLWVFGLFATLISSGGIVDVVIKSFDRAQTSGTFLYRLINQSVLDFDQIQLFFFRFQTLGDGRLRALVTLFTLSLLLFVLLSILSQAALLLGIENAHAPKRLKRRIQIYPHFWSLLLLAVFNKLFNGIIILSLALPIVLSLASQNNQSLFFSLGLLALYIPLLLIINTGYMMSVLGVVHHKHHPLSSIYHALQLLKKHWWASLEYSLLLFILVSLSTVALLVCVSLLVIPYGILLMGSYFLHSLPIFLGLHTLMFLLFMSMIIFYSGAVTTFQYTAWSLFYHKASHLIFGQQTFSKTRRLLSSR